MESDESLAGRLARALGKERHKAATLLYGILISPIIAFFMTASFESQRPETLMIYSIYALIGALPYYLLLSVLELFVCFDSIHDSL